MTTTTPHLANLKFSWKQLVAQPDPDYGIPSTRSSHGVSVISTRDGGTTKVLVYGGEHVARTPIKDESNRVWVYQEDATNQWKCITCTGPSPPPRVAHAQAMYQNRYLYVFGGRAGIEMKEEAMNDLWVLDTETYQWDSVTIAAGDLPEARSFHRMICIGDSLYVFGGCGAVSGRLADLHRFHIDTSTWEALGTSTLLRGRGGPNLVALEDDKLGVIAGFAGEETADGHVFDLVAKTWNDEALTSKLEGMRPRSVCVSCSLLSAGVVLIFGGEVDPSDRGHEGAGGFENDLVVLDSKTGALLKTIKSTSLWPSQRGWADADSVDNGTGSGQWYIFGGLAGDDMLPVRLNDLWKLEVTREA